MEDSESLKTEMLSIKCLFYTYTYLLKVELQKAIKHHLFFDDREMSGGEADLRAEIKRTFNCKKLEL